MKKMILNDLRVELDPPQYAYGWSRDMEARAKKLEAWAKELEEFLRDHRSQDAIDITVIRDTKIICTHCKYEWETDDSGSPLCCDKAIDEFEAEAKIGTALAECDKRNKK